MRFHLPIYSAVENHDNILVIGVGGGFDIYCGLPIVKFLMANGHNVTLANYSFTNFDNVMNGTDSVFITPSLVKNGPTTNGLTYDPEGYLVEGSQKLYHQDLVVYSLKREGAVPVLESLKWIMEEHDIQCIISVDGGIDSIFHGDEEGCGTILEDSITMSALSLIPVPKYHCCIGMTTEIEERVCNFSAMELISEYIRKNGFLGASFLGKDMEEFKYMKALCEYCWAKPGHKKSHISSRIIPSVEGGFTVDLSNNFLMSLYLFFDFDSVMSTNVLVKELEVTRTFFDGVAVVRRRKIEVPRKKMIL